MTISVRCACGAKLKAKDSLAGKKAACPKCAQPLRIPTSTSPEVSPPDTRTSGGAVGDPLGLPAGDALGMSADHATATTGDPFDLGDLSAFDSGAGVASPLGAPMQLPSHAAKPASSLGKKMAPAKDHRMVLIAAISSGVALVLLLVGGLVAWRLFSGGSEVAENPRTNKIPGSASVDPAPALAPQGQGASGPPSQSTTSTPSQPNAATPGGPYAGAPGGATPPVASDSGGATGSAITGNTVVPTSSPPASQQAAAKPQAAPGPSPEKPWYVLSELQVSPPSVDSIQVSVDWKLVHGRPQPGRKYLIYVHMKVVGGFVGRIESLAIDLNAEQGTVNGELPAKDANGFLAVQYAVVGDAEGEGLGSLASGELRVGKGPTAAQPLAD